MRTQALSGLFHVLLATVAVGTAACSGSTADEGTSPTRGPGDPPEDAGTSASTDGSATVEDGQAQVDAAPDRSVRDAVSDAVSDARTADVFNGCANGVLPVALDPTLCCATPGDPLCGSSSGNDVNHCALDCRAVCERAAPGSSASGNFNNCGWSVSATTTSIQYVCGMCGVGRIPGDTLPCDRGDSVADRLAMQAYYESASVAAFDRLERALVRLGAPASLALRAQRASTDERRHAALFARLARERGVEAPHPVLADACPTLYELALENATEGCVRETYGALMAVHQAAHADDPELRAAFAAVSLDETAHAALSWDLARWFDARLSVDERARVDAARDDAERTLCAAASRDYDAVDRALGLPSPAVARALFARLFEALPALDVAA